MERHAILLVEDDEAFANSLRTRLEAAGDQVEPVKNADQGIVRATQRRFDAVVTDLQLPGRVGLELMGGLRLVTDLRRAVPGLPIIVVTAYHSTDAAIEAIKLGAFDYLIKPAPLEGELSRFVSELLNLLDKAVSASRLVLGIETPEQAGEEAGGLIGRSPPMQILYKEIGRLAGTTLPVLITGEAGTGKELVARTLHQHSNCADGPFIVVNCRGVNESALTSDLLEAEKRILQHQNGNRIGAASQVSGGTVFLDELSALSSAVLHALARIIRQPSIHRRDVREQKPAIRVLAATNSDPKLLWQGWPYNTDVQWLVGAFRRATIRVPPLRERREDVPELVRCVTKRFVAELGVFPPSISTEAIEYLQNYTWPGNLTELENVVGLLLARSRGAVISREAVAKALAESTPPAPSLTEREVPEPSESTETQAPGIPDYELVRQIGHGAYGEVWLARTITGGYRAAKIISRKRVPDTWAFEQEFSALKRIETISQRVEGLVRILHIGRNQRSGYYYYVMELADDQASHSLVDPRTYTAKTLASEIRKRGKLPLSECFHMGISLATALENLHGQDLVHRDIKPSNVIFVGGSPKLGDIGLVTHVGGLTYCGTPGYIAPEGPGRPRADVYSLGKVIYEMITGMDRLRFPELPNDSPPSMLRVLQTLRKASDNDPSKRYQSASELRHALGVLQFL